MEIRGDFLRIQGSDRDTETGDKIELEEKPAERVLLTDGFVTGSIDKQIHGSMQTSVAISGNVIGFAEGMRSLCATCKHFDQPAWLQHKRKMESSAAGVTILNQLAAALNDTGNANIMDPVAREQALQFMGVCHPITEMKNDVVAVHPESSCPGELCGPGNPRGLHVPVSSDAEKAGSQAFDAIMRRAAGER